MELVAIILALIAMLFAAGAIGVYFAKFIFWLAK
tara:strand:+ start:3441 stop:3542 length:102 start_codon:yes stop_codon:yes gene_type:complete